MENPRPDKVAVVDEVRERLDGASASIVTEYRGLSVGDLADLRGTLTEAGGDYKIFKNTLVRLAVADGPHKGLESLLSGPTAIAFVHGEVSAVAKALRDFGRANPNLIIKGGILDGGVVSSSELSVLADLPPREVLLARLAGAIAAPMTQLAGLLKALPQNLAYGLSALVEQRGGVVAEAPTSAEAPAEATAEASPASTEAAAEEAPNAEAAAEEAPNAEATDDAG